MTIEKDLQSRLDTIERGIRELETVADPGVRVVAQQLVQAILEVHGRSLERLLEIVHQSGAGPSTIDQLGRDPLVSPLLVLHALHPLTLEARVIDALESVRPALRSKHADAELQQVRDGKIRVRVFGGPEQRAAVERVILEAAPDAEAVDIEGADATVVGFVAVSSLRGAGPARPMA